MNKPRQIFLSAVFSCLIACPVVFAAQTDEDFWKNYITSGKSALSTQDYAQAESLFQAALDVAQRSGFDNTHLDTSMSGLAQAYVARNKLDMALNEYKQVLTLEQKSGSVLAANVKTTLGALASICYSQGNYKDAESYYQQQAVEISKSDGMNSDTMLDVLKKLADAAKKAGDLTTAETQYHQELAIIEKMSGMDAITTAESLQDLGNLYKEQARWADAIPYYERAIANIKKHPGQREGELVPIYTSLAYCDEKYNDLPKAAAAYKDALALDKKYLEKSGEVEILKNYSLLLRKMGDTKEAEKIETRADNRQAELKIQNELR